MAAQSTIFMDLLRILTPEEVTELTATSDTFVKVSLTNLLELKIEGKNPMMAFEEQGDEGGESAKILPFNQTASDSEETQQQKEHHTDEWKTDPQIEILLTDHFLELEKKRINDTLSGEGEMANTSTFILKEKKRFLRNQHILKSKEVYQLYIDNAALEIHNSDSDDGPADLSISTNSGVLINKKQF